jgi:hypothetical protein
MITNRPRVLICVQRAPQIAQNAARMYSRAFRVADFDKGFLVDWTTTNHTAEDAKCSRPRSLSRF